MASMLSRIGQKPQTHTEQNDSIVGQKGASDCSDSRSQPPTVFAGIAWHDYINRNGNGMHVRPLELQ